MKRFTVYLLLILALGCTGKLGLRAGSEGHADGEIRFWLVETGSGILLVDTAFTADGYYKITAEVSGETTFVKIEGDIGGE